MITERLRRLALDRARRRRCADMRVVFMGTPSFAAEVLEALVASSHEVVGVFTRPDAVRGRGRTLVASPVKDVAKAHGIQVWEFASCKGDDAYEIVRLLSPDVICVAAYGAILPKPILDLPAHGCLNVHGSLLPRWRGAAPIERAILSGDDVTGIGIMRMEVGLDTGDVCVERAVEVGQHTSAELSALLAQVGGAALVGVLDMLDREEALDWRAQGDQGVTYAEKIGKGELDISPDLDADTAERRVRASGESHASRCLVGGRPVTILRARVATDVAEVGVLPGCVAFWRKSLLLGCSLGVLELIEVKPDGKKAMEARAFAAGIQNIKSGTIEWRERL